MQSDDMLVALRNQSQVHPLSRREFITALSIGGTAALTGFALTRSQRAEALEAAAAQMGKLPKRQFGTKVGKMMVTPFCMCADWNGELYESALAMGCNYVHKASTWNSIPAAFAKIPRESYYTDIMVDSTPENPDDYDKAYKQVTSTLAQTGLKYYDFMRAHFGWKTVDALKTQTGTYKAFLDLKKKGLVKFFGCSQHDFTPYPEIIQAEIDCGYIDAIQLFYRYGKSKEDEEICAKASKAGIAMTAMKVYQYGHDNMRKDADRMAQLKATGQVGKALIRQVLNQPRADGKPIFAACVSHLGNMDTFQENIGGASLKVAMADGYEMLA